MALSNLLISAHAISYIIVTLHIATCVLHYYIISSNEGYIASHHVKRID